LLKKVLRLQIARMVNQVVLNKQRAEERSLSLNVARQSDLVLLHH
jgi:hypothetical protein